jgi:hypothetical protein
VEWPESKPSGREQWWWSRGAAEVAGKEVEGALSVGAELRAVSRSSERDRGGVSRWLNDGSMTMQWRRRGKGGKRAVHGGGCSFYSR